MTRFQRIDLNAVKGLALVGLIAVLFTGCGRSALFEEDNTATLGDAANFSPFADDGTLTTPLAPSAMPRAADSSEETINGPPFLREVGPEQSNFKPPAEIEDEDPPGDSDEPVVSIQGDSDQGASEGSSAPSDVEERASAAGDVAPSMDAESDSSPSADESSSNSAGELDSEISNILPADAVSDESEEREEINGEVPDESQEVAGDSESPEQVNSNPSGNNDPLGPFATDDTQANPDAEGIDDALPAASDQDGFPDLEPFDDAVEEPLDEPDGGSPNSPNPNGVEPQDGNPGFVDPEPSDADEAAPIESDFSADDESSAAEAGDGESIGEQRPPATEVPDDVNADERPPATEVPDDFDDELFQSGDFQPGPPDSLESTENDESEAGFSDQSNAGDEFLVPFEAPNPTDPDGTTDGDDADSNQPNNPADDDVSQAQTPATPPGDIDLSPGSNASESDGGGDGLADTEAPDDLAPLDPLLAPDEPTLDDLDEFDDPASPPLEPLEFPDCVEESDHISCPDEAGRIGRWLLLGIFPHRGCNAPFDDIVNPTTVAPRAGESVGQPRWFPYESDMVDGHWTACQTESACQGGRSSADLNCHFSKSAFSTGEPDNVMAYAFTYLHLERDREFQLRMGGDDGFRVWLNGELLLDATNNCRCYGDNQFIQDVRLPAGVHRLLVQVGEAGGHWGFIVRLTTAAGVPIRDGIHAAFRP